MKNVEAAWRCKVFYTVFLVLCVSGFQFQFPFNSKRCRLCSFPHEPPSNVMLHLPTAVTKLQTRCWSACYSCVATSVSMTTYHFLSRFFSKIMCTVFFRRVKRALCVFCFVWRKCRVCSFAASVIFVALCKDRYDCDWFTFFQCFKLPPQ